MSREATAMILGLADDTQAEYAAAHKTSVSPAPSPRGEAEPDSFDPDAVGAPGSEDPSSPVAFERRISGGTEAPLAPRPEKSLDDYLAALPDRCVHGYHRKQRHSCTGTPSPQGSWTSPTRPRASDQPGGEWPFFVSVLRKVVRADGTVHQGDVRPLIRGRIPAKHIGTLYKRARNEGVIVETGDWERSTDVEGRNSDKRCRIYRLAGQRGIPAT